MASSGTAHSAGQGNPLEAFGFLFSNKPKPKTVTATVSNPGPVLKPDARMAPGGKHNVPWA